MEELKQEQQTDQNKKRSDWDMRPYLAIGALIFLVFCCCIAVIILFFRYEQIKNMVRTFVDILQPILIGLALGYLFNPLMRRIEGALCKAFMPKAKNPAKTKKMIRSVSSIGTVLFFLCLVTLVIYLLVPAVAESIENLISTSSTRVESFILWYDNFSVAKGIPAAWETYLLEATTYMENWFNSLVVPQLKEYVSTIASGVISVFIVLKNVIVGLIVSIYVLMEKERFEGQAKKILFACLPTRHANGLIQIVHKIDQIFGGFVIGKIIDSIIIGILCFIGCWILRMPYTLLVSVIIGVTNIIPFFGPIIGAIPCLIIITITDPLHGLYFLIFVLALQQADGNIIGPKILGESTGLSSFWVIFAIMVGGELFGFAGMVIGVPAFAVIYYLIQQLITDLLKRKKLPTKTLDYTTVTHVDPETKELCTGDWVRNEPFKFSFRRKTNKKSEK